MDLVKSFLAGWVGGVGNLIVGHPFDTIKTLMQNSEKGQYKSSLDCLQQLVKKEGPLSLYKGVKIPMVGVGPVFAIYFFAYDTAEKALRSMKGINSVDLLPLTDVLICGASTALFGSWITGPAELIKIQQQTASSKGLDGSLKGVVKNIYNTNGLSGFTRGISATMLRDVPGSMAWFGVYNFVKQAVCEDPNNPTVSQALLAGGCGGLGMWSFAIPLDAIKTRVQASRGGDASVVKAFTHIMKDQGIKGFYRGVGPALLRAFPANAATFAAKESAQAALDKCF
eukprot:Tbor_TRINITY_DN5150_c0_g1::TRINITY_DN5150_c0_g1_i3::g.26358::m.26358/K15109/SLC25A20_29, CACT, CACL, CRC1; solute carrier family 25 (mitochondrial carnitine/acylcarnitine transporter), member 20/29